MRKETALTLAILLAGFCVAAQAGEWVSLFDGKTLKGWTQRNGTASYVVRDGTIEGNTTPGSPNSFLCSDQDYGDFELEVEVLCDEGLNSGIQIRSRQKTAADVPPGNKNRNDAEGRVFGPQVEIETGPGEAGYVYGEATGLGWLSKGAAPDAKGPDAHDNYKNGEWNKFRIVAKGPRIQTWINGVQIEDITHEEIYKTHPKGFIALQVHGIGADKGPYKVQWRNIRVRTLD